MSRPRQPPDELLRAVELTHENYMRSLRAYQQALAGRPIDSPALRPSLSPLSNDSGSGASSSQQPQQQQQRRGTNEHGDKPSVQPPSLKSFHMAEGAVDENAPYGDADLMSFIPLLEPIPRHNSESAVSAVSQAAIQRVLPQESFSDEMLIGYLKNTEFGSAVAGGTALALEGVVERRPDMDGATDFGLLAGQIEQDYVTATCEVYEVDRDATVTKVGPNLESKRPKEVGGDGGQESQVVDSSTVWKTVKVRTSCRSFPLAPVLTREGHQRDRQRSRQNHVRVIIPQLLERD